MVRPTAAQLARELVELDPGGSFAAWWAPLQRTHRWRDALRAFDAARTDRDDATTAQARHTLRALLDACRYAAAFDADRKAWDIDEAHRQAVRAARDRAPGVAQLLDDAARAFAFGHPGFGAALRRALPSPALGAAAYADQLRAVAGALRKLSEASEGPPADWLAGNLRYPRHKAAGKPSDVSTFLLFELVVHLRRWTAGRALDAPPHGEPMPTYGRPLHGVAAEFCSAALGVSLDARQVKERLRWPREAGARLDVWPNELAG